MSSAYNNSLQPVLFKFYYLYINYIIKTLLRTQIYKNEVGLLIKWGSPINKIKKLKGPHCRNNTKFQLKKIVASQN
jgi:hypothetical protein